ncbi:MAG TPA: L-proline dehydrogenase, partial [archaeon]|nr:L-proline dehydrogenase [archaeon]
MTLVNRAIVAALDVVPKGLLWRFARRYVAGETLAEAIPIVRDLNVGGLLATLDILGEHVASPEDARADGKAYGGVLRVIQRDRLS